MYHGANSDVVGILQPGGVLQLAVAILSFGLQIVFIN